MATPLYNHNCEGCHFITTKKGIRLHNTRAKDYDLHVHFAKHRDGIDVSVILRYGNMPGEFHVGTFRWIRPGRYQSQYLDGTMPYTAYGIFNSVCRFIATREPFLHDMLQAEGGR